VAEKVLRRSVGFCVLTDRADKILECETYLGIVIDNEDRWIGRGHRSLAAMGNVN
jgi:hypothetical protein